MIINHHPLIDYTKCYECKFDLPEHEVLRDQGKDYCYQCYNKLLELYYGDKYKL